jgi:hypothetical protein
MLCNFLGCADGCGGGCVGPHRETAACCPGYVFDQARNDFYCVRECEHEYAVNDQQICAERGQSHSFNN